MNNLTMKLKGSVRVEELDTSYNERRYLLYCENKRWQINEFLYTLIILIQNGVGPNKIKAELSKVLERDISDQELSTAIDGFLINRGIIEGTEDKVKKKSGRSDYLWLKIPLIRGSIVERFKFLQILFVPQIVLPVLLFSVVSYVIGFIAVTSDTGVRFGDLLKSNALNYTWALLLSLFAVLFHELGHMAALMKNGIKPGNIGFAFYYTSPVFYSDVNSAWELKRKQRILVDVGGIYFQIFFLAVVCMVGIIISSKGLILSFIIGLVFMANNLNPFIKMDGYWIASDLMGVPNLHKVVSAYIEERLFYILRIKTDFSVTSGIRKREKRIFVIYVLGTFVYMTIFTLGLFKLSLITFEKVFTIFEPGALVALSPGKMPGFIVENIAIVITAVLLTKIVFTTISKLLKAVFGFLLKIKNMKRIAE